MLLLTVLTACDGGAVNYPHDSDDSGGADECVDVDLTGNRAAASTGAMTAAEDANAFAVDLYRATAQPSGNSFVSPLSVDVALGMAMVGARGQTESEMREVLHVVGDSAAFHTGLGELIQLLNAASDASAADPCGRWTLSLADRLFGQQDFPFEAEFLDTVATDYAAPMQYADFIDTEAARQTINTWVSSNTAGKIPELYAQGVLSSDTKLVLVNAVYFKGTWALPFDATRTAPGTFTRSDGSVVETPLMRADGMLAVASLGNADIVELPYRGHDLAMDILLPHDAAGLAELEGSLDAATLADTFSQLRLAEVVLTLPKFEIRQKQMLADPLTALGMPTAFEDGGADFTGTADVDPPLYIKHVVHEAWIAVDEVGAEAAAATGIDENSDSAPAIVEVQADHPFVFVLRDRVTGVILFMGRVEDPASFGG